MDYVINRAGTSTKISSGPTPPAREEVKIAAAKNKIKEETRVIEKVVNNVVEPSIVKDTAPTPSPTKKELPLISKLLPLAP